MHWLPWVARRTWDAVAVRTAQDSYAGEDEDDDVERNSSFDLERSPADCNAEMGDVSPTAGKPSFRRPAVPARPLARVAAAAAALQARLARPTRTPRRSSHNGRADAVAAERGGSLSSKTRC